MNALDLLLAAPPQIDEPLPSGLPVALVLELGGTPAPARLLDQAAIAALHHAEGATLAVRSGTQIQILVDGSSPPREIGALASSSAAAASAHLSAILGMPRVFRATLLALAGRRSAQAHFARLISVTGARAFRCDGIRVSAEDVAA